jgi:hypothetical protein
MRRRLVGVSCSEHNTKRAMKVIRARCQPSGCVRTCVRAVTYGISERVGCRRRSRVVSRSVLLRIQPVHFHELAPKPSSFRRAALARIFWRMRFCAENELPQRTDERMPTRIAYNPRNQVSLGLGDQVSISCVEGRVGPSGAGSDPTDLPWPGCSDRERARRQEPRAHPGVASTNLESIRSDEKRQKSAA